MAKSATKLILPLFAVALVGCASLKQGLENLNQMAAEQGAKAQAQRVESWKRDIKRGVYSGKVRVALIPVVPAKKGKSGIVPEKAVESLKKHFGAHNQFELLDDKKTESLKRDLHPHAGSLNASRVNQGAKRRANFGGVDADVILRTGMKLDSFVGLNKSSGKIGRGVKVVCWTEYMVIGGDKVKKGKFEETNIFKNEQAVVKAAEAFHKDVLENLMITRLKELVAQAEADKANTP